MSSTGDVKEFPFQIDEFYLDLQSDGSTIAILDQSAIVKMPFPGLRPFKTSEFQLFKGRVDQAEELIKRLEKNKVLAVIGSSGTGKSSLVRAGLIPQLLGGYLHDAGTKWNIAICRPGKNPVENLAIALSSVKSKSKDRDDIIRDFKIIEPLLSQSVYGILDVNELLNSDKPKKEKHNLLIIIDQFEEIFRFQKKDPGKEDIASHFVNLLLKAAANPDGSVYVIITMRSEFLGDCVKFRTLPEAINEGQYLVPQLTHNQLKEAIQGPIRLAHKTIEPGLVELLINEIDENKLKENLDQLPILQHALMRSYNQAMLEGDGTEISHKHYELIGTMKKALANHAETKYAELGDKNGEGESISKKQKIAKIVFQALTDTSSDQKGGRRPIELAVIYAVAASLNVPHKEISELSKEEVGEIIEEVNKVINHFRETETSFIMPPDNTTLHPSLILDIAHESLMRNWARLNDWMDEEANNGKLYKMLNERRLLNEQEGGNDQLIRGILLTEMLSWKELGQNSAWASRYHTKSDLENNETDKSIFDKNIDFLQLSNQEAIRIKNKEKNELLDKIKLVKKNRRRIIAIIIVASIICITCFTYTSSRTTKANDAIISEIIQKRLGKELEKVANRLILEIKLPSRNWWKDSYLMDNKRQQIKDSLVNWSITNRSQQNVLKAERLDYLLRILHEAENLSYLERVDSHKAYLNLISYAHQYSKKFIGDTVFTQLNIFKRNNLNNEDIENDATLINAQRKIGMDYYRANNYTGTILAFKEISDRNTSDFTAFEMIGRAYYSSNNPLEAISFYKKADSLNPNNSAYLSNLGEAYIAAKDIRSADNVLNKAIEIDPRNPSTLGLLGQLLYMEGQSLDIKKQSSDSLEAKKLYNNAISRFKQTIGIDSVTSYVTYGWLIKVYKKLNQRDTANYIRLLKSASPGEYDKWFVLASYYDGVDYSNAIFWYQNYIKKVGRTFWLPYNNIALDFCRLSKPDCDMAIKYADCAIALTGTELILTEKQIQLSQTDFVQSQTQFVPDPPNPYAHKAYAWLIKSQAQKEDTIKYKYQALALLNLEWAINIDPNYPKTHFYYACYYAVNGKKEEAIKELSNAIEKGFNDKNWIQKEAMLSSIRNKAGYRKLIEELEKDPTAN